MPLASFDEQLFYIELFAFAAVQRLDAIIKLGTEFAKLLDVRQQLLPNLLLVGVRQGSQFSDGTFECLDHGDSITQCRNGRIGRGGYQRGAATPNLEAVPLGSPSRPTRAPFVAGNLSGCPFEHLHKGDA